MKNVYGEEISAKVEKKKICKYCKSEINAEAKICPFCKKTLNFSIFRVFIALVLIFGFTYFGAVFYFNIINKDDYDPYLETAPENDMPLDLPSIETMSQEEIDEYKEECDSYTYEEISRNPDKYVYKSAFFKGEVIQVLEDGNVVNLRVNITKDDYYWDDTIYVVYNKRVKNESRILEDDIVKIYGMLGSIYTYESTLGVQITLPLIYAEFIEIE